MPKAGIMSRNRGTRLSQPLWTARRKTSTGPLKSRSQAYTRLGQTTAQGAIDDHFDSKSPTSVATYCLATCHQVCHTRHGACAWLSRSPM